MVWLALLAAVLPMSLARLLDALPPITERLDAFDHGYGPRQLQDFKGAFVPETWTGSG
jgi:hypothetical protein